MDDVQSILPSVEATQDDALFQAVTRRIDEKTKPLGALGRLEEIARRIALIQRTTKPELHDPTVLVFAGDHGVTAEGVSVFPPSVTHEMVKNFLHGGAAINVFARQNNCALKIIDAGISDPVDADDSLLNRRICSGTRNFAKEPAMSAAQLVQCLRSGIELPNETAPASNVFFFGEMGIGNTTSASALMAALTGRSPKECVGAGSGLAAEGITHKTSIIQQALALHQPETIADALRCFGGFEILMMAGAMVGAASRRSIIVADGHISTAALLVACRLVPEVAEYAFASHCSAEAPHRLMCEEVGLEPLLNLGLRLGEGTGAVLVYPLLLASVNFLNEMASFAEAGVSESNPEAVL
ncbi:MAG: nicotinate-nucleotide--dimethylbenzimidazole phosphoribosyltransferase [Opitutales bacterium]